MYYAILLKVNASRSGGDVFRAPAVHVPIAHCPSELFVVALVLDKSACGLWACQAPTRPRQIHIDIDTRYTPASHYYLLYFSSHCCPLVRLLFSSSEAASPSHFHKNVLINVLCARDRLGGGGCDISSRVFPFIFIFKLISSYTFSGNFIISRRFAVWFRFYFSSFLMFCLSLTVWGFGCVRVNITPLRPCRPFYFGRL